LKHVQVFLPLSRAVQKRMTKIVRAHPFKLKPLVSILDCTISIVA